MTTILPEHCETMAEVRCGVDAIDAQIVPLLATRFAYMAAAARIKPDRDQVRDESRKAQVIANATALAAELGAPADRIAALWDALVETSISYELDVFDHIRAASTQQDG
jgi:isochorismate pyruvate lyase